MKTSVFAILLILFTILPAVAMAQSSLAHPVAPPAPASEQSFRPPGLAIGGYGEFHFNGGRGDVPEALDIHRFVVYLGYQFNRFVRFNAEMEMEHAFVSKESGGEIGLEQFNLDIKLHPFLRIRIGRFLAPMGLINTDHEPTKFNGVERPLVARYIIPTTWSPDGVEVSGGLKGWFNYTFGVVSSLDGSAFSATNGIRDGRVKERPGFASSPTLVGRFEATPFPGLQKDGQLLRIGGSVFHGPVDAGNKGIPNSIESDFTMFTADLVFSIAGVEMKGVLAYTLLTDSATLNPEVAKNMLGYYVEAAYSLPRTLTRPVKAERIILFGRFERFDTQFRMFDGTMADPGGDRSAITAGLGWYLEKDAVLKLDYTRLETVDAGKVDHLFSAGVGFRF